MQQKKRTLHSERRRKIKEEKELFFFKIMKQEKNHCSGFCEPVRRRFFLSRTLSLSLSLSLIARAGNQASHHRPWVPNEKARRERKREREREWERKQLRAKEKKTTLKTRLYPLFFSSLSLSFSLSLSLSLSLCLSQKTSYSPIFFSHLGRLATNRSVITACGAMRTQ